MDVFETVPKHYLKTMGPVWLAILLSVGGPPPSTIHAQDLPPVPAAMASIPSGPTVIGVDREWAGHAGPHSHAQSPMQESLYRADKDVDEAWEAFHQAALGGTLTSPAIQTQIEQALHESRLLLVNARQAAQDNDERVVSRLTARIQDISTQIKEKSRRQKT